MTNITTQAGGGQYAIQIETDNKEYYLLMQDIARRCLDGKPVPTISEPIPTCGASMGGAHHD